MFDPHNTINNINTSLSVPNYHHQVPQFVQPTGRRYRLVRQISSDGMTEAGVVVGASGASHSLLQPAYSSPHINQYANTNISTNNIYAEVENDYEIDSGFTEESSERKDESLYTNSSSSSHGAAYYHDHQQVGLLQ